MNKYKTFEELKEELGDKFEDYMYKTNIELLTKIDKALEYIMTELITEWDIKNDGYVHGSDLPVDAITPLLTILQGENNEQ